MRRIVPVLPQAIAQCADAPDQGAIVVVEPERVRIRLLPLKL